MVRHLTTHSEGFCNALPKYMDQVGVLIINAIYPLLTTDIVAEEKLGFEKKETTVETLLNLDDFDTPALFQKILTKSAALALLMRTDHTITYLDPGGFDLPWCQQMMKNADEYRNKYVNMVRREHLAANLVNNTKVNIVMAPCLKRAGDERGEDYQVARVVARSVMMLV